MARYRKKRVMVEAFRLGHDFLPDWFMDQVSTNQIVLHGEHGRLHSCLIHTLEGVMCATEGDWIIQGVAGEIYPCKAPIFAETYEALDG